MSLLKTVVLVLMFVLASCASIVSDRDKVTLTKDNYNNKEKAIIILKVQGIDYSFFQGKTFFPVSYSLVKTKQQDGNSDLVKTRIKGDNGSLIFSGDGGKESEIILDVLTIDPGEYYLDQIVYGVKPIYMSKKSHDSKNRPIWGTFEVSAGEVVYLGDVTYTLTKKNKANPIQVAENFSKTKEYLKVKFPYIETDKIKLNLMKVNLYSQKK